MHNVFLELIKKSQNRKIMVIGDMVADVYLEGQVSRISREAPVLILEHMGKHVVPGGAANAVHNAAALGGMVHAVGIVGQDYAGEQLKHILQNKKVNTDGLMIEIARPTITKTRIMAGGQATVRQQVVRIDRESKEPLSASLEKSIKDYIIAHITDMDGVVISDYGSYAVSSGILRSVINTCQMAGIPCLVDSRYNIMEYIGVTIVKQNESEVAAALGYKALNEATLITAGQTMLERLNAQAVVISRGPDGMTLFERVGKFTHIPVTNKSEVYDVTGAGDTVVATMILALTAGASYLDATRLANFAAGVVVRKLGAATTTPDELRAAIRAHHEDL